MGTGISPALWAPNRNNSVTIITIDVHKVYKDFNDARYLKYNQTPVAS